MVWYAAKSSLHCDGRIDLMASFFSIGLMVASMPSRFDVCVWGGRGVW